MKTFIYTLEYGKNTRTGGRPVTVSVWQIKRNKPVFIGSERWNTAAWIGGKSAACRVICEKTSARMADGYRLQSDQINVIELQTFHK